MTHNRKYVTGSIALPIDENLEFDIQNGAKSRDQDKVEKLIIDAHFLDNAPFKWIGLFYIYGLENNLIPKYSRIDKKDGELPIQIDLDVRILHWADNNSLKLLYDIFMIGAIEGLIHVGKKYNLPIDLFLLERKKYGNIPNTIEECEEYVKVFK